MLGLLKNSTQPTDRRSRSGVGELLRLPLWGRGEAVGTEMTLHQPAPDALQRPNTYVGAPVERVEDLRFLRGRGTFLDDLARPGQWHAAFVRSPRAHGTIRNIDIRNALAKRGVRAVIAGA